MLLVSKHHRHVGKIFLSYLCYSSRCIHPRLANNKGVFSSSLFSSFFLSLSVDLDAKLPSNVNGGVLALNICIIAGSTRTNGPPRPILSDRITSFVHSSVAKRGASHNISILKAKDIIQLSKEEKGKSSEDGVLPLLERPHFAYPQSQMPNYLKEMHKTLASADAYIAITPEYNHSPCPGLMNLMNHFGSSTFGFKPSGIVSYSAGQWGGTRAAHSLRPFLSELGCLPVSAMVHIPNAAQVLNEDGELLSLEDSERERWNGYVEHMVNQLEWWGEAASHQRSIVDPQTVSPAFRKSPSERNAPN